MNESSVDVILVFTIYKDMGKAKHVLLTLVLIIYLVSVFANAIMMLLIYLDASLHKPMYIFLFSLVLNGLIGSTAVWPKVMNILLTDDNTISQVGCVLQIVFIRFYRACIYTMLTVMAYDRSVAVFNPLDYHTIMNPEKVRLLVLAACFTPLCLALCEAYLLSRIRLCGFTLKLIFCDQITVTQLSCDIKHSQAIQAFGTFAAISIVLLPSLLVLLSYVKIILLMLKFPVNVRKKTFATCAPHLTIFSTFTLVSLFGMISKFITDISSARTRVITSYILPVNYILLPPLLHPFIYGINSKEIKTSLLKIKKRSFFNRSMNPKCSVKLVMTSAIHSR